MQVSGSNQVSPNFGSLIIAKGAAKNLKTLPKETLDIIKRAGTIVENTRYYHVAIDEDLSARMFSLENPYYGLFKGEKYSSYYGKERIAGKSVESNNVLMLENEYGTKYGVARYSSEGEKPVYNVWNFLGTLNKAEDAANIADVAKILDDAAVSKYQETLQKTIEKNIAQAEVDKTVDDLMNLYGA